MPDPGPEARLLKTWKGERAGLWGHGFNTDRLDQCIEELETAIQEGEEATRRQIAAWKSRAELAEANFLEENEECIRRGAQLAQVTQERDHWQLASEADGTLARELDARNGALRRQAVALHGALEQADEYFRAVDGMNSHFGAGPHCTCSQRGREDAIALARRAIRKALLTVPPVPHPSDPQFAGRSDEPTSRTPSGQADASAGLPTASGNSSPAPPSSEEPT